MALGCCVGCATKKETKKSPEMQFPVPDYRRNGKPHIPGGLLPHPNFSQSKEAWGPSLSLQINCTVKILYPFGFAPPPKLQKMAWAHKPAILMNRINMKS